MPAATTTDATTVRDRAEAHLRALVGRDDVVLYDDQWAAISALAVDKRRSLVVQRTGWGKSAVYFVATLLLRAEGAGPTVIVSPLLALMRNQIAAAERAGIRAVTINSTNVEEWEPIQEAVAAGGSPAGSHGPSRRCSAPRRRPRGRRARRTVAACPGGSAGC